jgi:hypothetical protein
MNAFDFTLYHDTTAITDRAFVELQVGKGRRIHNSVFIRSDEFVYIEGVIWDKHREYGMSTESKILDTDWIRIIEGFEKAMIELQTASTPEDITRILKLRNHQENDALPEALKYKSSIIQFFADIITWLRENLIKKAHVIIIKDI